MNFFDSRIYLFSMQSKQEWDDYGKFVNHPVMSLESVYYSCLK